MSKPTTRRRNRLFKQDPHCFWCGRECVNVSPANGILPLNAATLDHLRSRGHPKRLDPETQSRTRTVLACKECNQRRGIEDENLRRLAVRMEWQEDYLLELLEASIRRELKKRKGNGDNKKRLALVYPSAEGS